jgi:hypothetical protein
VEDFVAAAVFATALAALFVMAGVTLKPFLPSKIVEAPIAPSKDAPTIKVYVYNHTGRLYAVEYAGRRPRDLQKSHRGARHPCSRLHGLPRRLQLHQVYPRPREDRARPLHGFVVPAAV